MRRVVAVVCTLVVAACGPADDEGAAPATTATPAPADDDGTPDASPSPTPTPRPSPSASPTADTPSGESPSPSPSRTVTAEPDDDRAGAPPVLALTDLLAPPRLVVVHDDTYWVSRDGGPWRRVAGTEGAYVDGDGRWLVEWDVPDPTLRSIDDPAVTCTPPDGFFGFTRPTALLHDRGLTSVFVAAEDGSVASVVCEDPDLDPPVAWSPPTDHGDGEYGPFLLVEDGITLQLRGDAEGNVTVFDETGEVELIPYAISGPHVDGERGLLVYVAQDGGMHFAGGTLVVTDLAGVEQRRVDLGGTSVLAGLVDAVAVVERVDVPADFAVTGHLLVDVETGDVLADVPTDVRIAYVGD